MARIKKSTKQYIMISVVLMVVVLTVGLSAMFVMNNRIRSTFSVQMEEKDLYIQQNTRHVYRTLRDISAGEVIGVEDLEVVSVMDAEEAFLFYDVTDLQERKVALVDIPQGVHLLKFMVNQQGDVGDLREVQYTTISVTGNVTVSDVVDVRISFPNGEDYVVLSQKEMRPGAVDGSVGSYFWLSENEIMLMSAAMVDAYLYTGSRLYTTKYIAPTIQNASAVTYTPSTHIINLIYDNPNILSVAVENLSIQVRKELESRLAESLDLDVKEKDFTVTEEDIQKDTDRKNEQSQFSEGEVVTVPVPLPTPTEMPLPTPTETPVVREEGVEYGE